MSPRKLTGRLTLTRQVVLLSLVPMVVLGFVLARLLQTRIVSRTLADQGEAAQLIARIGIQPRLTPAELEHGLDATQIQALDGQLRTRWVKAHLARIKIWNADDVVVYSDDHSLIGHRLMPSDDLEDALDGRPDPASIVNPRPHTETAGEVGLGTLVEVYVPLRFHDRGRPAGAFEMYLSYRPIAGSISRDKTMIALVVGIGLAALWLMLYPIVSRASRRLRRQSRENHRLARYDQLTGLPNRVLFSEGLARAVRAGEHPLAVLAVDLDGFKQINNTLGTATGDEILRSVAGRLTATLDGQGLLARLGNDEFAILASGAQADHERLAAHVQEALAAPFTHRGVMLSAEATIGAACYEPEDGEDGLHLLQHAEAALARARTTGARLELYSPDSDRFDPAQLLLLGEVRAGLEREEFVLDYQPKLDLASGHVTGVEALVRWQHPARGLLGPMEFVPLIEPTSLVGPLTYYVIERASRQLSCWRREGLELGLAVNLSVRNLLDPQLPDRFFEILAEHELPAEAITVEVTESAAMGDSTKAIATLERLRAGGAGVSIDDFGTGNASIEYLARLPASELKIDRSFVSGICEDPRSEAIVRSTIDLARHFHLKVVAEGIETPAVLAHLTELGCDTGQGYLISKPVPPAEIRAQLISATRTAAAITRAPAGAGMSTQDELRVAPARVSERS